MKYEEISGRIEYEIASFLNEVSSGDISEETSVKIKAMYKIIGEMESLGDSGEAMIHNYHILSSPLLIMLVVLISSRNMVADRQHLECKFKSQFFFKILPIFL